MKKKIDPLDYAKEIMQALKQGVLLTTKAGEKVDTMTIGWGTLGIEWNRPVFAVYVRTGRFTHEQLERNPEFTVSIPLGAFDKRILGKAGTLTGRKVDKIGTLGLTLIEPDAISVPAVKEFPLTLECKVIYKTTQAISDIRCDGVEDFYPPEVADPDQARNNEPHTAYYGEIVSAYIIEQA